MTWKKSTPSFPYIAIVNEELWLRVFRLMTMMKPLEQAEVMALLVLFRKNLGEMIFIFRRIYFLILK